LFTDKKKPTRFRQWLLENCQLSEVSLFPDKMFRFSDHECSVLLGRRHPTSARLPTTVRCRRVREEGRESFQEDYHFTTDRTYPQSRLPGRAGGALWVPELEDELWAWLRGCPRLESIAALNQGVQFKNRQKLPAGARTVATTEFPGSVPGYASSRGRWPIHDHPPVRYFNLSDKTLFRREGSGTTTGTPQVISNYRAAGRGVWRLKPFIDEEGLAVKGNLITVRPFSDAVPLEYLWALLCSPLANAYVYTHSLKRDILITDLYQMPVPNAEPWGVQRVVAAARAYLDAAREGPRSLFSSRGASESHLHDLLRRMDAEVLRLYGLPAKAERLLLDLFTGQQRPGVPGRFVRYYPPGFTEPVPLYAYLSESYQRYRSGGTPALPGAQQQAYDRLVTKKHEGGLSPDEQSEIYTLQAEVDGRDYTALVPDDSWLDSIKSQRRKDQSELGRIADELASLAENGNMHNENQARS
jgi:hypothetical protein